MAIYLLRLFVVNDTTLINFPIKNILLFNCNAIIIRQIFWL